MFEKNRITFFEKIAIRIYVWQDREHGENHVKTNFKGYVLTFSEKELASFRSRYMKLYTQKKYKAVVKIMKTDKSKKKRQRSVGYTINKKSRLPLAANILLIDKNIRDVEIQIKTLYSKRKSTANMFNARYENQTAEHPSRQYAAANNQDILTAHDEYANEIRNAYSVVQYLLGEKLRLLKLFIKNTMLLQLNVKRRVVDYCDYLFRVVKLKYSELSILDDAYSDFGTDSKSEMDTEHRKPEEDGAVTRSKVKRERLLYKIDELETSVDYCGCVSNITRTERKIAKVSSIIEHLADEKPRPIDIPCLFKDAENRPTDIDVPLITKESGGEVSAGEGSEAEPILPTEGEISSAT